MKLLKLTNGHFSAEFGAAVWPILLAKLRRHGDVVQSVAADIQILRVEDAQFVKTDEWDGVALIATNDAADKLLVQMSRPAVLSGRRKRFVRSSANGAISYAGRKIRRANGSRDSIEA